MSDQPTRIEDLSDELFFDIFSFIHPKDLLQGWYNLNSHINAILRSIPISIEIKNNEDFDNNRLYIEHFCSQIICLKDGRLMPKTAIDVRSLINIQYLYLMHCSKDQLEHIHPNNQPHLTQFFSLSSSWSLYERILFGKEHFSNLLSIGCPKGAGIQLLNITNPINRTLRHLHLYSASNETIYKFLQYIPNMISLNINYLYANNSSLSITSSTKSRVNRLTIKHILSSQSDFDELILSGQFPNLTQLRVVLNACNFDQLAHVLRKLLYLQHLDLKIKAYSKGFGLDRIRRLSSWFQTLDYGYFVDEQRYIPVLLIKKSLN
jgi:hypothetical protein